MSAGEDVTDAIFDELQGLDAESALSVVSRWLAANKLERSTDALQSEVAHDPSKWGSDTAVSGAAGSSSKQSLATPKAPPVGEALPVPGTSTRPGRLFDAEPIDPASVREILLTKPDPVFFGERDDKRREQSATEEFPLMVRVPRNESSLGVSSQCRRGHSTRTTCSPLLATACSRCH